MEFASPQALVLIPVPLLFYWLLPPAEPKSGALMLPPAIAANLSISKAGLASRRLRIILLIMAWLLANLALCGPRQLVTLDLLPASGRDVMLVLDLSGSMETQDFDLDGDRVSRLAAVQSVASRFVRGRAGDRVGLVVFGDRAYVAAAPTHNVEAVAHTIETSVIGVSGKATAIADGLGLAMKRLRGRVAKSRVIILLSDGRDTSGLVDPVAAARTAQSMGIRIHTIALGPDDLETAPQSSDAVDSGMLRRIAEVSGGELFRVLSTDDLRAVARAIDRLEPSAANAPPQQGWRGWWIWPAAAAFVLGLALLELDRRGAG